MRIGMKQSTFASLSSFEKFARRSRREEFLGVMERVVPWRELEALIEPHYPKAGNGRQPVGLSIMLRVYFLQQWFSLSDPGAEDALYESPVLRRFAGVDLGRAAAPDATIIEAPSSTKNSTRERDPEMHQTKKGNQWHFGMKAHIGVDSKEGIVHSVCSSAASVSDVHMLPDLLHGDETKVWGDGGYQGQGEVIREAAPKAQDMTSRRAKYKDGVDAETRRKNRTKARVRAKVEWPFRILKRVFGFTKVRYRGLKKNHEWLLAAFALVNLYQHRKRLAPLAA